MRRCHWRPLPWSTGVGSHTTPPPDGDRSPAQSSAPAQYQPAVLDPTVAIPDCHRSCKAPGPPSASTITACYQLLGAIRHVRWDQISAVFFLRRVVRPEVAGVSVKDNGFQPASGIGVGLPSAGSWSAQLLIGYGLAHARAAQVEDLGFTKHGGRIQLWWRWDLPLLSSWLSIRRRGSPRARTCQLI